MELRYCEIESLGCGQCPSFEAREIDTENGPMAGFCTGPPGPLCRMYFALINE